MKNKTIEYTVEQCKEFASYCEAMGRAYSKSGMHNEAGKYFEKADKYNILIKIKTK